MPPVEADNDARGDEEDEEEKEDVDEELKASSP